jgi:tetratricopeptide (TPR) repeat protein
VVATETELKRSVERWIRRGGPPPAEPAELAAQADLLLRQTLTVSARRALDLSRRFEMLARALGSRELIYVAQRAVARAAHTGGDHRLARRTYLAARRTATAMGDRRGRAQIDRALVDLHLYLNRYADARKYARRAIETFRRLKSPSDVVQTEVNLANLYHRQDRHRDAAKLYRKAEAFFAGTGHAVGRARAAYNLGNTQVQLCEWEGAVESYQRALTIYTDEGFDLDANDARYGLAYIELLSDRFASALTMLEACEQRYREGGDPRGVALCKLDLSEAYLGLGLYSEAQITASDACRRFRALKLRYETARARLFLGRAHAGLQDVKGARLHARQALRMFRADGNRGMTAAALLLLAELTPGKRARPAAFREARRGFERAQLPIWSMLCDLQLFAASSGAAAGRRLEKSPALRRVPHWSALYDSIAGERALAGGRTEAARAHFERAASTLERARAALPPLELRTAYLAERTEPYSRLVALETPREPKVAVRWAERLKTAGLWAPSADWITRTPETERLQAEWEALSHRLAASARALQFGPGRRAAGRDTELRMRQLERRSNRILARLETRRFAKSDPEESLSAIIASIAARLPVVVWHATGRDLYAFVLRGNDVRAHIWPDGITRLALDLRRWRFLLERHMLGAEHPGPPATFDAERAFWSGLGAWLWKPLEIDSSVGPDVLLVPTGALFALPFAALRVDDQWLGDRHRLSVTPSLRHYDAVRAQAAPSDGVEIFEAPHADLPAVRREVEALVGHLGERCYTLHRPAGRQALLNAPEARLWHFAGHARFRADNPFYSTLQLEDGPVFAADLRTRRVAVALATLSACHSGGGAATPGEEFSGLVRSVMEMGARSVIAGLWPVADASTAFWMSRFYARWLSGASLGMAIQEAQAATRERWPSPYHWGAFALFGAES